MERLLNRQVRTLRVDPGLFPVSFRGSILERADGPRLYTGQERFPELFMTPATYLETRVPLVERGQVPGEASALTDLYDKLYAERGCVPNMFKALANVPALALGIAALLKPLMGDGALVGWYKELIATRVASLNRCEYCISAHRYLAGQRGATPEQVASLDDAGTASFETGPFTEKEKAGFRYADLLHESGHAIDESAFAAVTAHFNSQEIIELTAVAAAFEFFPRFNSALHIPVTPLPEGAAG
jgi:uncharacterized peroxidase-related enzyme